MFKILFMIVYLLFINIYGEIFPYGKIDDKIYTLKDYYNSIGIDDISLRINECDKEKKNCNTDIIINSFKNNKKENKVFFNFDFGKIKIISKGRYQNHSAVIISHKVIVPDKETKNDKTVVTYWLISNKSGKYTKTQALKTDSKILKNDDSPLIFENFGLLNTKTNKFISQTNQMGVISSVIIDENNFIKVSNGKKWINIDSYYLAKNNFISLYPDIKSNRVFIVVYKNINPFNKGLDLIIADFDTNSFFITNIYNSEKDNFGYYPSVYTDEDNIFITAKSLNKNIQKSIIINKSNLNKIKDLKEVNLKNFEKESFIFFTTGLTINKTIGVAKFYSLNSKSSSDYKSNYNILNLGYSPYIQAEIKNIQLKLFYTYNQVTNYREFGTSLLYNLFKSFYTGLSYSNGYSTDVFWMKNSSNEMVFSSYSEDLYSNDIKITLKYDTLPYINMNHAYYSGFYINGDLGIGINFLNISNDLSNKLKKENNIDTITNKYAFSLSVKLKIAYLFQKRFKNLKGTGFSFLAGYKLNTNLIKTFNNSPKNNELSIEIQRLNIEHGPFISFNWIF